MAKGFRLRTYTQEASPSVDLTFYVGVDWRSYWLVEDGTDIVLGAAGTSGTRVWLEDDGTDIILVDTQPADADLVTLVGRGSGDVIVADSVITSGVGAIPDIPSPEPTPYEGTLRSQNVTFELVSETVTSNLGDANDRMDWTGRLVDWSETTDDGSSYTVLWTGRCTTGPSELQGPGKFAITCQDENWLGRGQPLFTTSGGTTMLYPPGLVNDWAHIKARATPVWEVVEVDGSDRYRAKLTRPDNRPGHDTTYPTLRLSQPMADYLMADLVSYPETSRSDGDGNFTYLRFRDTAGGGADLEVLSFAEDIDFRNFVGALRTDARTIEQVWVYESGHGHSVGDEVDGYLYAPNAPPHPMNPRHVGGTTGQDYGEFLKDCFDGTLNGGALKIDTTTTLGTWNASTNPDGLVSRDGMPTILDRITEVKDFGWLGEKVLAPMQVVLFVNSDGEIAPKFWRIPQDVDPGTLTTLTASNGDKVTFDPRGSEAFTALDYRARVISDVEVGPETEDWPPDRVEIRTVTPNRLNQTHDNVASLGYRRHTFDLSAFRGSNASPSGGAVSAYAEGLAKGIAREVFERVGDGPVWYTVETNQSGILPGDYCILDADTLKFPNPADNARTGDRIVQVATRKIVGGGSHYVLECQDIGPSAAVLSAPTVSVTSTGKHTVDVQISGLGAGEGYRLFVDRGDGFVEEAPGTGNETVSVGACPAGTSITAKAVATKQGRTRSAFSATNSDTTTALTAPSATSATGSETTVKGTWTNGESTYGVRVKIDGDIAAELEPGSTQLKVRGLAESTTYNSPGFEVEHFDEYDGTSASDSDTFTTGTVGSSPSLTRLTARADLFQGRRFFQSVKVKLKAVAETTEAGYDVRWQRAEDSAGSPGTWETLTSRGKLVHVDTRPVDGKTYWYRAQLLWSGQEPGNWITLSIDLDGIQEGSITVTADLDYLQLENVRVKEHTESTVTYKWNRATDRVDEVWVYESVAAQGTTDPGPDTDTDTPTAFLKSGTDQYAFTVPDTDQVRYAILEPRDRDLNAGEQIEITVDPLDPEPPLIQTDTSETATTATVWLSFTSRGLSVSSVEVLETIGTVAGSWISPDRSSGGSSTVKGGTLGSGEYEHDLPLALHRNSTLRVRYTLETGEVFYVETPFVFDANTEADLFDVVVDGDNLTVKVVGDNVDTLAVAVERIDGGGSYQQVKDGRNITFDLSETGDSGGTAMTSSDTWTVRAHALAVPAAQVTLGTTTSDTEDVVVVGSGASAPAVQIQQSDATEPSNGSADITLDIDTDYTSGSYTMTVERQYDPGNGWTSWSDITSSLSGSPDLSTEPPNPSASYTWTSESTKSADTSDPVVKYRFRFKVLDGSSNEVDTATTTLSYNTGTSLLP